MQLATMLIPLIAQYGIPAAIQIWGIVANKTELTPAMIDQLMAIENANHARFATAITTALTPNT